MNDLSIYKPIFLPCGSVALFDHGSGVAHRCEDCGAVVGSMGQPRHCVEEAQKYEKWQLLGGKGWNYNTGEVDK